MPPPLSRRDILPLENDCISAVSMLLLKAVSRLVIPESPSCSFLFVHRNFSSHRLGNANDSSSQSESLNALNSLNVQELVCAGDFTGE